MSGAGWTSYWVTTGPALRPTIRAGMPKPASFLTMISSLRAWARLVAAGMERDRDVVEDRDRRQDVLDPVLGRRRIAGVGDVVGVAQRAGERRRAWPTPAGPAGRGERRWTSGPCSGPRPGWPSSSSPQTPVWPGDGGRGDGLAVRPAVRAVGRGAPRRPRCRGRGGSSSSAGVRRSDAAAVVPIQRAVPTAGLVSCRSGIPNATMTPRIASATSRTNAPGAENRSVSSARQRPPDRARRTRPRTWAAPAIPT